MKIEAKATGYSANSEVKLSDELPADYSNAMRISACQLRLERCIPVTR